MTTRALGTSWMTWIALRPRPSRGQRAGITVAGLFLVALLGILDYVTPSLLSLAVLYVLVVMGVTLLAGRPGGIAAAAASATAWVIGDSAARDAAAWTYVVNGALRSLALAMVALLVARLVTALAMADQSGRQSREFLATAAHQLRTPIAGLRASADALFCLQPSPQQEQILANLSSEAARAGRLITSLLKVARLDQGERLHRERVDLVRLIDSEFARAGSMHSRDLSLVLDSRDGAAVQVDAAAVREIIINLFDNAWRHADRQISVTIEVAQGEARVRIGDDGPGLPAGLEERAFDRFVSLDGCGGTGLGLPIARELARLHGGDLTYRDREFVVVLRSEA